MTDFFVTTLRENPELAISKRSFITSIKTRLRGVLTEVNGLRGSATISKYAEKFNYGN